MRRTRKTFPVTTTKFTPGTVPASALQQDDPTREWAQRWADQRADEDAAQHAHTVRTARARRAARAATTS